jgi:hypothetical protein
VKVNFPASSRYATRKTSAGRSCGGTDLSRGERTLGERDCREREAPAKFFHVVMLESEGRAGRLWVWIRRVLPPMRSFRGRPAYSSASLVVIGLTTSSSVCWIELSSQACSASRFSSEEVSPCTGRL